MWFEVVSNLKINLDKSELIPVREASYAKYLARVLGCQVGFLPSYLGLPLGAPPLNLYEYGYNGGKILETAYFMEDAVIIKRKETDFGKEYSI